MCQFCKEYLTHKFTNMKKIFYLFVCLISYAGFSQVTNSSISGTVKATSGGTLPGATVEVIHTPTGTKYFANTDAAGRYGIPAIRPGGPYTIKARYVGYKQAEINDVNASLGNNVTVNIALNEEISSLQEVVITKTRPNSVFSKGRTGASQQFSNREIVAVPVLGSRSINSVTKYNANAGSNGTFGGQDSRLNNFTIDGSVFNNGFGLGFDTQAGGRTGSTAISLDAIEQLQVNIAPYDVRQSGFVGSGINAVTKSGTNNVESTVYTSFRNNGKNYIGTKAGEIEFTPSNFNERIWGASVGAPLIKNKLFFFGNFETVEGTRPATTFTSFGSPEGGAQVSSATYANMVDISNFVQQKLGYETGPFENFDAKSDSKKFLTRLDWNINDNNKLTARYVFHNSSSDQVISNSYVGASLGNRIGADALTYKNSGYVILDNTRSIVLELNSKISEKWHNNFTAGYDKQIEDRALQGQSFPTIDIRTSTTNTANHITLGLDPFTPGNKLDYSTLHFTDNITKYAGKHTLLFGVNYERFTSNNLFFPGSNGSYTFSSIQSFKDAVNQSAANGFAPSTTFLPTAFQFRYSALPGNVEPLQILKSDKIDAYFQDDLKVNDRLKLSFGIRASRVSFENTALENPIVNNLTFLNGQKLNTGKMADTQILLEPRLGFNLDVRGDNTLQLRGGTGVFTGRPPFVFLSNAVGNNGVLTGFIDARTPAAILAGNGPGTGPYGFTPYPAQYFTPANATLPATIDLAFTDTNFKFPQVWKTNIAADQKFLGGMFVGTIEGIFSKNYNAINYYNANAKNPTGNLVGTDNRPKFVGGAGNNINTNVSNAIVLNNTDEGYFYSTTFKLEYPFRNGLWGSVAYTRSNSYDLMSAGSVAASSWTGARSVRGNNELPLSLSSNNTPNRWVGILGYKLNYGKKAGGATSFNLGYIGEQASPFSYTISGDVNSDGNANNDLIYVPNSASEMRFSPLSITNVVNGANVTTVYTEAQQRDAFDNFINQDEYLSTRRGQYAERNGNILPYLNRFDLSVTQDFYIKIAGKKNSFQFRADILNFGNFLNSDWGVSQRPTSAQILRFTSYTTATSNIPQYNMATYLDAAGTRKIVADSYQKNASVSSGDVWQAQFSLRYTFGK